ncbi:MAG: T9SS type A sorting domain-containing protein [Chlorobi bacterium]|nr:T9SS type A sorting domain-containing protein [Chlorobiota bacterium]
MNMTRTILIICISALVWNQAFSVEYKYEDGKKHSSNLKQTTAGCPPSSGFDWLDINNVRARINTGGDMWWDLPGGTGAKYYIPKAGTATSMFSGALWIGGLDINNQLKLAAQRYRQVGIDYWTGPLTADGTAAVSEETCAEYDRFFKITREQIDEFLAHTDPETGEFIPSEDYTIPNSILNWPAHGDVTKGQSYYLAPFYDNNGDGEYDPLMGDYPYYDITNALCHTKLPTMEEELEGDITGSILVDQVIKGDQTLWWVFNDKGNIHTETNGAAIGMEIRAQAFAFATNDVINNMTFYSYEIINRSTFELTQTFFSPWVDTDLGYAWDDFVGCDVQRGLGYCYNGTDVDGNGEIESYGEQPPAVGVDFFQGPYMDPDGLDNPKYKMVIDPASGDTTYVQLCDVSINGVNFQNGIIDDERFGMRRFIYHNNSSGNLGDPQIAPQYYNYLRSIWKDGTKMLYGGTGHYSGAGTVGPACDFMFPGDTDPCNWGTQGQPPNGGYNTNGKYWTEETGNDGSPNPPGDRRFMQSAGPFTLKAGAVNYITVGIPWARATSGGAWASVELLRVVDDKCQTLFDNCFKVIDGPTAPDLTIQELDQRLIFYISNSPSSNNYKEQYAEYDPNIIQPLPGSDPPVRSDSIYHFEGYQVYQLATEDVGVESLHDADQARLVAQFDIKNGISRIINYNYDESIGFVTPVIEVEGHDNGISHSFEITQDAFATGDSRLVNNKDYFYLILAYAYNNYLEFGLDWPNSAGQTRAYLSGRKNIGDKTRGGKPYIAMPHKTVNGTVVQSDYGNRPQITRIAGFGNGGLNIDLTPETVEEIMSKPPAGPDNPFGGPNYPIAYNPVYIVNAGPLNAKVVDPVSVTSGDYTWWMDTLFPQKLYNLTNRPEVSGDTTSKLSGYWYIVNHNTESSKKSDTTIIWENEQVFLDEGISVTAVQPFASGPIPYGKIPVSSGGGTTFKTIYDVFAPNNGVIEATIEYADSSHKWLSGIQDVDVPGHPLDWIRSGTHQEGGQAGQGDETNNDWRMSSTPANPWDPMEAFEKIIKGTWAPYCMTSYGVNVSALTVRTQSEVGPALNSDSKLDSKLKDIHSVDIVFTADKSKWTRSPVLEMGFDDALSEGHAHKFALRASPSIDKDGNFAEPDSGPSENENDPNYISDHGMGWFPGYAIDVETGERLNIMYGEDSYLVGQNGRDMQFNPPKRLLPDFPDALIAQMADPNIFMGTFPNQIPVMGGKHYVYIMGHETKEMSSLGIKFTMPAYDAGRYAMTVLDTIYNDLKYVITASQFFATTMYVGMPMGVNGEDWLANDVTIRIRIAVPYHRGYSAVPLDTVYPGMDVNNFYPMYNFSMQGLETVKNNSEKFASDLDIIRVVPNPYYAYSTYESNPLENIVKITNLPQKCTITIYDVSGLKVRQLTKDSPATTLEWDLKNYGNVPIGGGVYYLHITTDQGDKVVKFFAIMRVPDFNTF